MGEFLLRSLIAGIAVGVPAYVIGMLQYTGHRLHAYVVGMLGAGSGFLAGSAILIGQIPWVAALGISAILAVFGAFITEMMVKAQDSIASRRRK